MINNTSTKKKNYYFLLLAMPLLAIILITGCQPREQSQDDMKDAVIDTTSILTSLDSLRSNYQTAVNNGNFEQLSTLVTEDAKMVQPGASEWDAMRKASEGPFPKGATIDIKPMETHVMSNDWVYELGSSTITYTPENSEDSITLRDTYLVILKRTDDGWKVHREVASSMQLEE